MKRKFILLDGTRGLAALAVVTGHLPLLTGAFTAQSSYLAVDFFLVLSGFVIAHAYEAKLAQGESIFAFMAARLIRLYPLYILATTLGLMILLTGIYLGKVAAAETPNPFLILTLALFFLPFLGGDEHSPIFPLVGPAWSLFFELAVNLVYAVVFRWLGDRLLIIILCLSAVLLALTAHSFDGLDVGHERGNFLGGFARVGYSFFAGVLGYRIWIGCRYSIPPMYSLLAVLVLPLLALDPGPYRVVYDLTLALVVFPALVLVLASIEPPGPLQRACEALGSTSYGIYVLHVPAGWAFTQIVKRIWGDPEPLGPLWFVVFMTGLFVAVIFLDKAFDRPIRKYLAGRLSARRTAPAALRGQSPGTDRGQGTVGRESKP